jgi:hypothetical protein
LDTSLFGFAHEVREICRSLATQWQCISPINGVVRASPTVVLNFGVVKHFCSAFHSCFVH